MCFRQVMKAISLKRQKYKKSGLGWQTCHSVSIVVFGNILAQNRCYLKKKGEKHNEP
jgi:hypothetical protein